MELPQVTQLIQATLVPVIMISAEGLVSLVVQQRYGRLIDRLRALNYERLRLRESMAQPAQATSHVRRRMAEDEVLVRLLLRRARLAQKALFAAFLGMALFVATSLSLIIETLLSAHGAPTVLPLVLFTAGLCAFLAGFAYILLEVLQSLQASRREFAIVTHAPVGPTYQPAPEAPRRGWLGAPRRGSRVTSAARAASSSERSSRRSPPR